MILLRSPANKNADLYHLNEVETDELFDNAIHSALEGAFCTYMAKEWHKALRQEFGANETDKRLLIKEHLRLNAHIDEVEGTMKETLELVDKLWVDLDEANASKLGLENRTKFLKD